MNPLTLVVIVVAFAIGYKLIGWLMDRFKLSQTAPDTTGPAEDGGTTPSPDGGTRSQPYEDPETRYARVLGLPRAYTGSEITARYRTLMAQYHPDKVQHLGLDLQEAARRKTREIGEAYEYFRVKYNLRQASPSR